MRRRRLPGSMNEQTIEPWASFLDYFLALPCAAPLAALLVPILVQSWSLVVVLFGCTVQCIIAEYICAGVVQRMALYLDDADGSNVSPRMPSEEEPLLGVFWDRGLD